MRGNDMKKIFQAFLVFMIVTLLSTPAQATVERSEAGPWKRAGIVFWRGLVCLVGSPLEIPRTLALEIKAHPKIWYVSMLTRIPTNVFIRGTSAANDIVLFPPVALFTDDIASIAEQMGLPEYPWQWHEADLE